MNTIGTRMRHFAEVAFDGNIKQFADAMQMKNIHKYLNDARAPGADVLLRLWELGCDTSWLLTGTGEMYARNAAGQTLKAVHISPVERSVGEESKLKAPARVIKQAEKEEDVNTIIKSEKFQAALRNAVKQAIATEDKRDS